MHLLKMTNTMATSSPKEPWLLPMLGTTFNTCPFFLITDGNQNHRALLHDEEVYPQSSKFMPERFLDERGQIDRKVRNPDLAAFGFGRRLVDLNLTLSKSP